MNHDDVAVYRFEFHQDEAAAIPFEAQDTHSSFSRTLSRLLYSILTYMAVMVFLAAVVVQLTQIFRLAVSTIKKYDQIMTSAVACACSYLPMRDEPLKLVEGLRLLFLCGVCMSVLPMVCLLITAAFWP
ncbi:hypothetical protein ACEQ8H_005439 [Pleosporales sp. CAS-2024a]